MRTEKQREASRLNGAASHGPVTRAGKRKSARNSCSHGLYSKTIQPVPTPRYKIALAAIRAELKAQYHPQTPDEQALVEMAARSHCDLRRVWELETATFNSEIARQRVACPEDDLRILQSRAWRRLCNETAKFQALLRFEKRFYRCYILAMNELERLSAEKTNVEKTDAEKTNSVERT